MSALGRDNDRNAVQNSLLIYSWKKARTGLGPRISLLSRFRCSSPSFSFPLSFSLSLSLSLCLPHRPSTFSLPFRVSCVLRHLSVFSFLFFHFLFRPFFPTRKITRHYHARALRALTATRRKLHRRCITFARTASREVYATDIKHDRPQIGLREN